MPETRAQRNAPVLPWWTWVLPLIFLQLGSQISVQFKYDEGVAYYYLPTAISIVLVNIWGPWRTIPAVFVNATLSTSLWGIDRVFLWPVYAFPETLLTILSWYLFTRKAKGQYWLPDIKNLLYFITLGVFIPVLVEITLLQQLHIYFGDQPADMFWPFFTRNILSEVISTFGLCPLLLVFLTPWLQKHDLLINPPPHPLPQPGFTRMEWIELAVVIVALPLLTYLLPYDRFWFVYGLFSLYLAIRVGFHAAVIVNFVILLFTYILPSLFNIAAGTAIETIYIFLGTSLLFVFATITGRVISDLRVTENTLSQRNQELELANKELDRFVYSVSHDLSAPLKSILGLVHISRLTSDQVEHREYIEKIEGSVQKLESFIKEILDYSRNNRQELVGEQIRLSDLCQEILDNLKYMEGYPRVKVDMSAFEVDEVYNDRTRLKLILNNLLSNAIRFQKSEPEHEPEIRISSTRQNGSVILSIEDNGEGIKEHLQSRIFEMFFRGNVNSKGSGLGLYIAKEAAAQISSQIFLRSEYGKGSVFTVLINDLK